MDTLSEQILNWFFYHRTGTITAISEDIGSSIPTTTKAMVELEERGIIKNFGKIATKVGRSPSRYGFNPDAAYFVGIDIRKERIEMALCDLNVTFKRQQEVSALYENSQEFFTRLCDAILAFIEDSGNLREQIVSVQVNISGRVNSLKGASYSIFKFENNDAPLAEMLRERLGIPTGIENDTRAMAYSELMLGEGQKCKDFLYINASWGLGLSIIMNGQIYRGRDGYSGELGHIHAYDNNIICHCGKKGCLETEISGKALCRKLSERLEKGESSRLSAVVKEQGFLSESDIVQAALNEDPVAIELIGEAGMKLGLHIANLINIFNPQAIIVGGTLAKAGDYFLSPIELAVKRYSLRRIYKGVQIKTTSVENPGVTGACLLALKNYLKKA